MKLYLAEHKSEIKTYSLVVTCGGLGLGGCIKNCKSAIGKPPETAVKLRAKNVNSGKYSVVL